MKHVIVPVLFILAFSAFSSCESKSEFGRYGDADFRTIDAKPATELMGLLENDKSLELTVQGDISAVCQVKGCWMDMELSEDKKMKVRFKDYGFFVPKNAAGHRATIKGIASIDTITVAEQTEWARDAEKPEGEIAEIKEPKISYTFLAEGVIIQ